MMCHVNIQPGFFVGLVVGMILYGILVSFQGT